MNELMDSSDGNSDGLAERYARLWESATPDLRFLDEFLAAAPQCGLADRADVLRLDLTHRWRAGQPVAAEDYINRLGDPLSSSETIVDLIYTEFLVREELGQNPVTDEYYQRFPDQADVLRDQFALHSAMHATQHHNSAPVTIARRPAPIESEVFPRPFGRYELLKCLGRGGMGNVYLARDKRLDRQVAVKIPRFNEGTSPAMIARFMREAQAAAALNHPQLCPVYDVGQVDGVDYLTMPYITGGALSDRLQDKRPLAPEEAVPIVIQIARALEIAHQAGVVHRDLKPANILINEAGEPVITDFGLAVRTEKHDPSLTEEGGMLGTVAYMPPEQIGYHAADVGPRSDVYSLGIILFELLTGRPPFVGAEHEILRRTLAEKPPLPSQLRPELGQAFDPICQNALAKSPDQRFESMHEFADELAAALARFKLPRRKKRFAAVFVGLLMVCVVMGVVATFVPPFGKAVVPISLTDPFPAGAVWSGTYHFLPPHESDGPVTLTITERTDATFVGEYATIQNYRWKVRGTASDNSIQWELSEPLTEHARGAVGPGRAFITGKYSAHEMDVTYRDQGDDSRATLKLKRER